MKVADRLTAEKLNSVYSAAHLSEVGCLAKRASISTPLRVVFD